ncbi:MAG: site-specific integrase [Anaerohalosphaera sp.]|nr:site-specific integrase [Anaerohalosphaera sp.]
MKKVWIYKRKNISGWWVGWYESGKRKAKALPSKELAEHFKHIKYTQLNSDVFTGMISVDWFQMLEEYREHKKVQGVVKATLYEVALSLRNFERLTGQHNSKQVSRGIVDKFILLRGKEVQRPTLNKDIRNIKAFIKWGKKKRYVNDDIEIRQLKEDERPVKSLSDIEIHKLISSFELYPALKMRILLALGTGLRRGDIESLKVCDIDFSNNNITTKSRKTRKSMGSRPVPELVMNELKKYVVGLGSENGSLFKDDFNYKRWRGACKEAGLSGLKFHDLRKTFASILAQNGASTAVTQKLLEHSSATLTNKIYINVDPVLRQAVDQLPISSWLRP